jgi:hypothetical protein
VLSVIIDKNGVQRLLFQGTFKKGMFTQCNNAIFH